MLFAGASFNALIRGVMSIIFLAIFISIANSLLKELSPKALMDALPAVWAYVENYPFPFVLVGAFAMVNGLFFYLLRAPTALGRPIMDQLAGLRLYLADGGIRSPQPECAGDHRGAVRSAAALCRRARR